MTMHRFTLSPEQSSRVDLLVAQGRFATPEKALEHLLTQVLDDVEVSAYPPEILAHLRHGMAEADRGEFVSEEELGSIFHTFRGPQ